MRNIIATALCILLQLLPSNALATKSVPPDFAEAIQSNDLGTTFSAWTDIPGVTITFDSLNGETVLMASGVAINPSASCGFRFVVDGSPSGDPTFGDRTVKTGVNLYGPIEANWAVLSHRILTIGSHTVKMQQTGSCQTGSAYWATHLIVISE